MKKLLLNKAGKTRTGMNPWGVAGIVLAIVAVIGLLVFIAMSGTEQTQFDEEGKEIVKKSDCPDSTGILTVNAVNALNKGSAVASPTITAGVNGATVGTAVTSGSSTFSIGSTVEILVSKADYIDRSFKFEMTCGGVVLEAPLFYSTSDNPSIRVKNDDGDYMDNAIGGGAINQTGLDAGEVLTMDVELSGTSLESSGEGIYVIEFPAGSNANISKVELSGATSVAVPSVHTTINAGSEVIAFEVPALEGSGKQVLTLTVELGATKDLSGGVYTDWYAKQEFVDDNGQIALGIQDSDGDAKYENTLDSDFYIM